jgi:hypothetical protein
MSIESTYLTVFLQAATVLEQAIGFVNSIVVGS